MTTAPTRLEAAARRALASLANLISDSLDPGVEALGAQHELEQALIGTKPAGRCANDTDGDGNCAACAHNPEAPCRQPLPDRAAVLTDTDRQFLTFALGLAADEMASRGDEFGDEDEAALKRLRRVAAEEQPAETEAATLRAQLEEMTRCRDNALRALYRDDVETDIDLEETIAAPFYGPGWDWDEADLQRVVNEAAAAVRPAFGKLTQQRDKARERAREYGELAARRESELIALRARVTSATERPVVGEQPDTQEAP